MKEKSGSNHEVYMCFLRLKQSNKERYGHSWELDEFSQMRKVVLFDFECLKCGIVMSM